MRKITILKQLKQWRPMKQHAPWLSVRNQPEGDIGSSCQAKPALCSVPLLSVQRKMYIALAAFAMLGILFAYLSAAAWGSMVWAKDKAMFYLENPISVESALELLEQNQKITEQYRQGLGNEVPLPFCIWGQKDHVLVSNENLSKHMQVSAILFCGSPELIFEDCRVPVQEDAGGCLLDEKAAWELFGDTEVIGKEVTCESNTFIIRNVISGKEGILAFQASNALLGDGKTQGGEPARQAPEGGQSMDKVMQRITVQKPEGYSLHELESLWLGQYGIFADLLDTELLRGIGGFSMLLFPFSLCIFLWVYLYHQYKNQENPLGKAAAAGLSLALAIALLFFLKGFISIPDSYIPTRWSDFSFWAELWKGKTEAVKLLLRVPKASLDDGWLGLFYKTAGYGALAEIFLVIGGALAKPAIIACRNVQ